MASGRKARGGSVKRVRRGSARRATVGSVQRVGRGDAWPASGGGGSEPPASVRSASLPQLDARALRALGETADGHRDEPLTLVSTAQGVALRRAGHAQPAGDPIATVETPSIAPGRVKPTVTLSRTGMRDVSLDEYDAVFWTESSIEKFLLPYYGHMRILNDVAEKLLEDYKKPTVTAVAHAAPSISTPISLTGVLENFVIFRSDQAEPMTLRELLDR